MANRTPATKVLLRPLTTFLELESASGISLLVTAAIALAWANSPWAEGYFHLWAEPFGLGSGKLRLAMTLREWVNDALMAVFFLVVGLEIKRELLFGELASARKAALPAAAALGGMIVPATLFALLNHAGPGEAGWGIPMATDIAFAVGVLTLLGSRIAPGLKSFLLAVAIVDDLGAVVVIALFYTAALSWSALGAAAGIFALLLIVNRLGMRHIAVYAVLGICLWLALLESGVHATISGVLLAIAIPSAASGNSQMGLMYRMESALHPLVAFFIMPIFALANAGVGLADVGPAGRDVTHGVIIGLVIGKQIGVMLACGLSVRAGVAALPAGVTWRELWGVAILCGIGFTMSLFIAGLAFGDAHTLDAAKIGILIGSAASGIIGSLVLLRVTRPSRP